MTSSPIEDFLDDLLGALSGHPPRETRHLLIEAEAHLRDAVAEAIASGMTLEDAERDAVRRFGSPAQLARREASRRVVPLGGLVRACVGSGLLLGGLGGLAMGLSAIITTALGAIWGSNFIVHLTHQTHLASADCARWLASNPTTHSCYHAALADWAGETVANRGVLGILGAIAIGTILWLRRRWSLRHLPTGLPRGMVNAIGLTIFGAAGLWLTGSGIDSVLVSASSTGAGQDLGTAPAMLIVAAVFAFRLLQDHRVTALGHTMPD